MTDHPRFYQAKHHMKRYANTIIGCCIDVETTGLSPQYDEVIEIALLLFVYSSKTDEISKIIDEYTGLREPKRPISRGAYRVHGLTKHKLKGKIIDNARVVGLLKQTDFFISHNAKFDRSFIIPLFPEVAGKPWYCSMNSINWCHKGFNSKGLQNLLAAHGIQVARSHRALDDARAVVALINKRNPKGKTYLSELLGNSCINRGSFHKLPIADESQRSSFPWRTDSDNIKPFM